MESVKVTASTTIEVIGFEPHIYTMHLTNTGVAGVAGWVEIRDATALDDDNGTLRWREYFTSAQFEITRIDWGSDIHGLQMPDGLRITLNTVTNVEIWIGWDA